jgi:NADH-quinone oxidoreductase subunit F
VTGVPVERAHGQGLWSRHDLAELRKRLATALDLRMGRGPVEQPVRREVLVCAGGGCLSCGSGALADQLEREIAAAGLQSRAGVVKVGCLGLCGEGPLLLVVPDGTYYKAVEAAAVRRIVEGHLGGGVPQQDLELTWTMEDGRVLHSREVPFFAQQVKIALRNCGVIDPASIEEYVAADGYRALEKVLFDLEATEVLETLKRSGLRGRGGAGFPAGLKWQFVREAAGDVKYVVCNADEGDPGAFMDRSILEGDPLSIIEAMTIAGRVIGSRQGYVYVRAEYPLAIERLGAAMEAARQRGLLGGDILGSGFDFDIEIRIGAGAFVCGEETALMRSIEGRRGTPRPRPPFPAQSGLWNRPTLLNNVETWANVPPILLRGADWFSSIGTQRSKGTKVFALAGAVRNTGLVEVPMGISLREVVEDIGGGVKSGLPFKAAQSGGPSGGCIPASAADVPIDYESLQELGAIMGSGGLIVLDQGSCMVELARFFLEFLVDESCGKCPPCRIGTRVMLNILQCITSGRGRLEDLELLESLADHIQRTALCGLGQTAPNAVLSTLRHFREEYLEHIEELRCRACACKDLVAAPCSHACPAGVDVPRYMREAAAGHFDQAYLVVRERLPLPLVCGLVCFAPCEDRCRRAQLDETLSIRAVKRAAVEYGRSAEPDLPLAPPTGKRVAVVGSGPAGLSAAYYLARKGHEIVVLEALEKPGGMLRYGIPRYRLPEEQLDGEIHGIIESAGVEIRTGVAVLSAGELLGAGYDAVFLAIGAHRGLRMGIAGEDEPGVVDGVGFLRAVAGGASPRIGPRVAVVGGGNTAVDAARTAVRLGAEGVSILYRRSRKEMPADPVEIEAAIEEGVGLAALELPTAVHRRDGRLIVECVGMQLGEADASGRRRPKPVAGSEHALEVDTLIVAIGQQPDVPAGLGVELSAGERAAVEKDTLATGLEGVFAGGDFVLGPASVIEAIAQGRRAATSIDRFLGGDGDLDEPLAAPEDLDNLAPLAEDIDMLQRLALPHLPVVARRSGFEQVEEVLDRRDARREAGRCLRCDLENVGTGGQG